MNSAEIYMAEKGLNHVIKVLNNAPTDAHYYNGVHYIKDFRTNDHESDFSAGYTHRYSFFQGKEWQGCACKPDAVDRFIVLSTLKDLVVAHEHIATYPSLENAKEQYLEQLGAHAENAVFLGDCIRAVEASSKQALLRYQKSEIKRLTIWNGNQETTIKDLHAENAALKDQLNAIDLLMQKWLDNPSNYSGMNIYEAMARIKRALLEHSKKEFKKGGAMITTSAEFMERYRAEIYVLQNRIGEALNLFEYPTESWDEIANKAVKVLRGEHEQ